MTERPASEAVSDRHEKLRRLLDVGRALVGERHPEAVLEQILSEARALTGARYAALGILDESRLALDRFLTSGVDPATYEAIGALPRGRGVLGVLIADPRPLRLADVGRHPESYGFPPGHPSMRTFLGVPVVIRREVWGNLYLTEKCGGGEFTDNDEEAALVLAQWAAIAIENARAHSSSERRRRQLERAVRSLEASQDIADAVGSVADLDHILELIAKRGRALVGAQRLLIMLRQGDELWVAAAAGHGQAARGHRLPIDGSTSGEVLRRGRPERVTDAAAKLRVSPEEFGVENIRTALLVPLLHRGEGIGVLAAFDHGAPAEEFSDDDERLLRTFAQAAANAVAIKRSVEAERLRTAISAAEAERARWARELHDQTLQALGGLRVLLAANVGRRDPEATELICRQAVADIELEIANLREIISDLRPSLLDDIGLVPAIDALIDRRREGTLQIERDLSLGAPENGGPAPSAELETTVFRIVQEGLTNVVKHADARTAHVAVGQRNGEIVVEIRDDGHGFDTGSRGSGFGLAGIRERVDLVGGHLTVESGHAGTRVRAVLPVH